MKKDYELYKDEFMRAAQVPKPGDRAKELLEKLNSTRFFKDSVPAIDREFCVHLIMTYNEKELREELNKMYIWLLADPRRRKKNYRRFIVTWMNNKQRKFYIEFKTGKGY